MNRIAFGLGLLLSIAFLSIVVRGAEPGGTSAHTDEPSGGAVRPHARRVTVNVDADKIISHVSPFLFGLNVARWDEDLFPGPERDMLLDCDRDAIRKVRDAGFTLLKYPGGNDADHYIWNSKDNSAGEMNTDEYAAFLKTVGAQGFITINFNQPPALAAEWVRYCNKIKDYGIKYWEIGDEQWGAWAAGHTTPEKYAERFIEFAKAMKTVDPTIKVAADVKPSDDPNDWTCRLLKVAGNYIDMVTFSYYPLTNKDEDPDSLFASLQGYRHDYSAIRSALRKTLPKVDPIHGKERADTMWIADVGYNSVNGRPGPITLSMANALWVGDLLGTMAELGESVSCYWALHNSYPPRHGDYGILSEDGKNIPSFNYYVFPAYTRLFGTNVVRSYSPDKSLSVYSSLYSRDTLSVILINKDRRRSKEVAIELGGFDPEDSAAVWMLNSKHRLDRLPDLRRGRRSFVPRIPPYSLVVLHLLREGTELPPENLALQARATASTSAKNGPNFGPSSAVDGKDYTRWASAALWGAEKGMDPEWFQVDLGRPRRFDRVVIRWAEGYGIDFKLSVSVDGRHWKRVFSEGDGHGGTEQIDFRPTRGRYIKLSGSRGSTAISSYSIFEFQVFNNGSK